MIDFRDDDVGYFQQVKQQTVGFVEQMYAVKVNPIMRSPTDSDKRSCNIQENDSLS